MINSFQLRKQVGMTLVEIIVVIGIFGILAAITTPNFINFRYTFRFNNDAAQMEYLVKYARIYAMENSVNVGICVQPGSGGTLTITDLGANREADPCNDGELVRSLTMEDHVHLSTTASGNSMKFDSRGIMISGYGTVCVSYEDRAQKVILHRVSLRVEEGTSCD